MIIKIAPIGFCSGVKNTIDIILMLAKDSSKSVFLLGWPVHNENVMNDLLTYENIFLADKLEKAKNDECYVVFKAHGHTEAQVKSAEKLGYHVIDGICPFLKFRNDSVKKYSEKKIVIGYEGHDEVNSLLDIFKDATFIDVNNSDKLASLPPDDKYVVVFQSTIDEGNYKKFKDLIKRQRLINVCIAICPEYSQRLLHIETLGAKKDDTIIVVTDSHSSNGNALYKKTYEMYASEGVNVYKVNDREEVTGDLKIDFSHDIYIMSATSTPMSEVDKVYEQLKTLSRC